VAVPETITRDDAEFVFFETAADRGVAFVSTTGDSFPSSGLSNAVLGTTVGDWSGAPRGAAATSAASAASRRWSHGKVPAVERECLRLVVHEAYSAKSGT